MYLVTFRFNKVLKKQDDIALIQEQGDLVQILTQLGTAWHAYDYLSLSIPITGLLHRQNG